MTTDEMLLWWDALHDVLLYYEPFSDSEGQKFWIDWMDELTDEYQKAYWSTHAKP